jgi:protein-S-isoprenylcysteine O-methyltransferase Ste14
MKITALLVYLQLLLMILFFIATPPLAQNMILFIIELFAIALGAWAIVHMVFNSRFSGRPEPAQSARLLSTGPFTYIRNPMYSAVLLWTGTLLLDYFTLLRLTIFVLLAVVLLKKISIEENLLPEKFKGYAAYKSRTRRLIPFIY